MKTRWIEGAIIALALLAVAQPCRAAESVVNSDGYVEANGFFFKAGAVGDAYARKDIWRDVAGKWVWDGHYCRWVWQKPYSEFVKYEYSLVKVVDGDQADAIIAARAQAQNTVAVLQAKASIFIDKMTKAGMMGNLGYSGHFGGPATPFPLVGSPYSLYSTYTQSYGQAAGYAPTPTANPLDVAVLWQQLLRSEDGARQVYADAAAGTRDLTNQATVAQQQYQAYLAYLATLSNAKPPPVTTTQTTTLTPPNTTVTVGQVPTLTPPFKLGRRLGMASCAQCHSSGKAPDLARIDASTIAKRLLLPETDPKRMPPMSAPQPSAEDRLVIIQEALMRPELAPAPALKMPAAKE